MRLTPPRPCRRCRRFRRYRSAPAERRMSRPTTLRLTPPRRYRRCRRYRRFRRAADAATNHDLTCRALVARSVAVEGLALRACTLCGRGRFGPLGLHAPWPWKVWRVAPARSVLRGGEAAPPISESANQPISRALRWSARVFVEKGAALPTVVRNRKFMQSHILSCRGVCYSMDVSMSVSCSSSFLLSLHTEAPRRFARGLFRGRERKLKKVLAFCEALVV